jgi:hypothetical protein
MLGQFILQRFTVASKMKFVALLTVVKLPYSHGSNIQEERDEM